MKNSNVKDELKKLGMQDLKEKLDAMRRELFGLRLNAATKHVKDYSQFNKLKKNIARAVTYLRQSQAKA